MIFATHQHTTTKKKRGQLGEDLVARHLEHEGFIIIERNYTRRYGELDLVARRDDLILFIEVKMRTSDSIDPTELVGYAKQKKITLTALTYLAVHNLEHISYRFDVACVIGTTHQARIIYIPGAF